MHFYYAARSKAKLEAVCQSLCAAFDLPPFTFDGHDHWRYGAAECHGVHWNITRASNHRTIETWMPTCPKGVNYQLILTAASEPPNIVAQLTSILGTTVTRYDVQDDSKDG